MNTDHIAVMAALQQIHQHFRHLGVEVPSGLVADLADLDAHQAKAAGIRYDATALRDAVEAALDNGKDPATDKAVVVEITRRQLDAFQVPQQLERLYETRRADALSKHAPAVIDVLVGIVADADRTLHEARESMPNLNVTDNNFVTRIRPEQMGLWGRARESAAQAQRAASLWHLIVTACRLAAPASPALQPLILADLTADQLDALPTPKAEAPIYAGHRLSLATPDEYTARCQRVEKARAEVRIRRAKEARTGRREPVSTAPDAA